MLETGDSRSVGVDHLTSIAQFYSQGCGKLYLLQYRDMPPIHIRMDGQADTAMLCGAGDFQRMVHLDMQAVYTVCEMCWRLALMEHMK
jgi:hypothetical protein